LLKDVKDLVVLPEEQHLKQMRSADSESDRADPPVFVLKVRKKNKDFQVVLFSDEQMANRVAKAMVHAVELCGGGGKPEPF
jgi:CRISPR/Cas system CMR subunit Cmr6 (Cas7 group RAMP superfamily)